MNRKIIITDDGSSSIFVEKLGEHYHSHFGAKQESEFIFINSALKQIDKAEINIIEFGFGTGLNALLSMEYAVQKNIRIKYKSIEKYPVSEKEYMELNFSNKENNSNFIKLHSSKWEQWITIMPCFRLYKTEIDFRHFEKEIEEYDIVFFDAFAPDVQPHLWTKEIFANIYNSMKNGGIFITYTVKGDVRRLLKSVGFNVEKIPGPPGKREITRAWKL